MKQIASGVILLALTMTAALFAADNPAADAVVAAHRKFFDAYKTCNTSALGTLVADDMQFLHVGGNIENKAQFVKNVSTCSLVDLTSEIFNTRMYGDTGIITGKLNYKTKGGSGELFFTEVFIKKNGAWTFVSHQSTAPAAPRPAAAK